MSANWPYKGWQMMDASRNAVATQDEFGPRPRSREIVGRAVLTTLPSKAESRMGTQSPMKHRQNPTPRTHSLALTSATSVFSDSDTVDGVLFSPKLVHDEDLKSGSFSSRQYAGLGGFIMALAFKAARIFSGNSVEVVSGVRIVFE